MKTVTLLSVTLSTLALAVPMIARAADSGDAVVVTGHPDPEGLLPDQTEPRAISAIATDFIVKQAPTFNAYQLVNLLPGANVSSSDPYGLSTSSSLTLRGLGQDAIGVVLEGAPQNDIGYYVAYPGQFADTENVRQVTLAQGSADIDAPVVSAAGGVLSLTLDDPHARRGALLDLSAGSYGEKRAFARFDTGTLGQSNLRAFVSYSYNRADNWRGPGFDTRQHVDAKLLNEWGNGNHASLSLSWNLAWNSTYLAPALADWQAQGRAYNLSPSYAGGDLEYWRLYRAPFRNIYAAAPVHLRLSDALTLDSSAYLQLGYGNSPYGTQLATTGNWLGTEELTQPISLPGAVDGTANVLGNYTGRQLRAGDVAKLTLTTGGHTLVAGLWGDYGTDRVVQSYTSLRADGTPIDAWGYNDRAIRTADGRLLAYENERTVTVTKGAFLADTWVLTPQITLDAGVKAVSLLRHGVNYLPGPQGDVHVASFAVLPRAALHWRIDDRQQVFANVTTGFRAPDEFSLYNVYDLGETTTRGTSALRNEYVVSQELGYRYIGRDLSLSLTGFHYHFRNRHIATVVNSGGALVNTTLTAGGQTSYGLDGEIDWRPAKGVSLYASGEWLHARLDDDLPVGNDYLPTRGRRAVASPAVQFGLGGTYDDGHLFGSAALKYVARQYATFTNDESIPGYATLDLAIGLHLAGWIDAQRTDLRLNVINATNPHVLSGVQGVTAAAQDTIGRNGTTIAGAAPTYYIGAGRAFVVTVARAF